MHEGNLKLWLSPQTDPLLTALPPSKLAPSCLDPCSIVVLHYNCRNSLRNTRAFQRVLHGTNSVPVEFLERPMPFVLTSRLNHADALLAQFELICCDIISIFIPDNIVADADPKYLARLYNRLSCSTEFVRVKAIIKALPKDDRGERFLEQFLGEKELKLPFSFFAATKKVRIMQQWGSSIDGLVEAE